MEVGDPLHLFCTENEKNEGQELQFLKTARDKRPVIQKQILTAMHACPKCWYEGWREGGVIKASVWPVSKVCW